MLLWHFRSTVLKGFYASEVYATGRNKATAIQRAGEAFDQYVKTYHKDMGYWPLIQDYFNEEGLAESQITEQRRLLLEEAEAKFKIVGTAAILTHS